MTVFLRLLPALLVALATAWIFNSVFQSGIERERNKHEAREVEIRQEVEAKNKKLRAKVEALEAAQQLTIVRVQNENIKQIKKRDDTIARLSARGLYVAATRCEDSGLPGAGKGSGTGEPPAGTGGGRVRLPEAIERDLWDQARDASEVVELYKACREIVTSPVCNVELVE